ncbi:MULTISPECIES: ABC transporter ATP-binding protein [Bacillaceae]|uniref:ABC transporter ATP-binding protein n=1 Tax=Bacillaceae TaxID=186817 RepID=UPI0004E10EF1|nr:MULTISPECIES: ABC transporter ATP-binding protein [Bacillaceae]MCM3362086.1 ABC transporter ATP-binding protein [Niallia sp. MER TA 168]
MVMLEQKKNIIEVNNMTIQFQSKTKEPFIAVNNISFHIKEGETYGLVGESGSGKSTTVRAVMNLVDITSGNILYKGKAIGNVPRGQIRKYRKELQMIFQEPISSLDPKKRVGQTLVEVLKIHKLYSSKERVYRCIEMLEKVGLSAEHFFKYPHQLSGGQAQRVCIARALIINPSVLVCDEPVSALDVSIQAQIINLLLDLKKDMNLTQIFIAHDLSVVRHISDRIGTMYLGNIVEEAPTDELFSNPLHPYTQLLLSSIPTVDSYTTKENISVKTEVVDPSADNNGCKYKGICPFSMEKCKTVRPEWKEVKQAHFVACHLYE